MPPGRPPKKRHGPTLKGVREKQSRQEVNATSRHNETNHRRRERIQRVYLLKRKGMEKCGAAFSYNYNDDSQLFSVGNLDQVCPHGHCSALNFAMEKVGDHFSICCGNGKVLLPPESLSTGVPSQIMDLLTSKDKTSKNFRDNILNYNSALAFASLKATVDRSMHSTGPYTYRIHGHVYTRTSNLKPTGKPVFSQLFVLDPDAALNERMGKQENGKCQREVMALIDDLLRRQNPYAIAYKMLKEVEEQQGQSEELKLIFIKDKSNDQRRYNLPLANEVAVIFTGADGEPPESIDFVVHTRDGKVMEISHTSCNSDPMLFPILFPTGEKGWHERLEHHPLYRTPKYNRLTMREFFAFRIAVRRPFSILHNAGKLFQQYIVMSWVKAESNNLFYINHNQSKLRVERYTGLMDFLANDARDHERPPGRVCILPSTFVNSPRNMQQNYQDAMAIVNKYGRPDLFITMTCNPKWPEITGNLAHNQKAEGRPDLVARVFNLKLKELLSEIEKGSIFGKVQAMIHVIEFQKRGLPHAHILMILDKDHKIRGREMIDEIVSAEVPVADLEPNLYQQVLNHMVHGPCGVAMNKNSPCMDQNKCSKDFPKQFVDETQENVDGYPLYRRRIGQTFCKSGKVLDNRWIVPYNKYLLHKYDCHINVEICSSIKSVKYLYKYVYKGYDCLNMELRPSNSKDHDEVEQYVDGRTVTPPEAAWRLFAFPMHKQSHTIVRLPVHLPLNQNVIFTLDNISGAIAKSNETALTAFFKLCEDTTEDSLFYPDVGVRYRFDTSKKKWIKRSRGDSSIISRMYGVSPHDRERYFSSSSMFPALEASKC